MSYEESMELLGLSVNDSILICYVTMVKSLSVLVSFWFVFLCLNLFNVKSV